MNIDPDNYFGDYENLEIHDLMLKDRSRQEKYRKAIFDNSEFIKDKIVLDVGAGTGILSCFFAQAGAKLVFAVEASSLANIALEVIEENELTSVVKVIRSRIEDFKLPSSIEKVDILVSEWMGFYLFHEGMLDSIIYARDAFLNPDGLMFPEIAMMSIAPCSVPGLFKYYENVDGVKMTKFAKKLREQKSSKPEICLLEEADLLHQGTVFFYINLMEVTPAEIEEITYGDSVVVEKSGRFEGFCVWWEVQFPSFYEEDMVFLATGPEDQDTHWKHCVIVMPDEACANVVVRQPISYKFKMKRSTANPRRYNIEVELKDPNEVAHPVPCDCHMTKCIVLNAHLERIRNGEMEVEGGSSEEDTKDENAENKKDECEENKTDKNAENKKEGEREESAKEDSAENNKPEKKNNENEEYKKDESTENKRVQTEENKKDENAENKRIKITEEKDESAS